jgi:hypothetical protein
VVKLLPTSTAGTLNAYCAEVRDTPTATNYLYVCVPAVACDNDCWPKGAGSYQSMYGTLRTGSIPSSGGYRLNANALPMAPNPKLGN